MANMGYCRFENTVNDVEDCFEHMDDIDLSKAETANRCALIKWAQDIVDDYGHEIED